MNEKQVEIVNTPLHFHHWADEVLKLTGGNSDREWFGRFQGTTSHFTHWLINALKMNCNYSTSVQILLLIIRH